MWERGLQGRRGERRDMRMRQSGCELLLLSLLCSRRGVVRWVVVAAVARLMFVELRLEV